MLVTSELIRAIKPEHVLVAIGLIQSGEKTSFAESTKYDLVYNGHRFPPKMVTGLALKVMTGVTYGPAAFKGGQESACFHALQAAGFTIANKPTPLSGTLVNTLSQILELQKKYDSKNTSEMQRRGILVRTELPEHLRANLELFEPLFSSRGYSFDIEGKDGVGRKVESPWVRLFDPEMSPSATTGWYVVIHFSRDGGTAYLTLGCGATTFVKGSLVPVNPIELESRVKWARSLRATPGFNAEDFYDPINLHGNSLSKQSERAIAFASAMPAGKLNAEEFLARLQSLTKRLLDIYDAQRLGKDPLQIHQDIQVTEDHLAEVISPSKSKRRGQGRGLSAVERSLVEKQAMDVAKEGLLKAGFISVEDVSASESYDFKAMKDGLFWFIEVKGTTSSASDMFLLTAAELKLHRGNIGKTALALVSEIRLAMNPEGGQASGGKLLFEAPWNPDKWIFEPTAYRAERKA